MELALAVRVRATSVSFRRPLDHNFQRTLPLPPPTTIVGLAASALGLNERELWKKGGIVDGLRVAAIGHERPGLAVDAWTLCKIKGNKMERSPYRRELLFFTSYTLLYGGTEQVLESLRSAFTDPANALSLGREDELVDVEAVEITTVVRGRPKFEGTFLPYDVRNVGYKVVLKKESRITPLLVESFPTRWSVDRHGRRAPANVSTFTFLAVGSCVEVTNPRGDVWRFGDHNFQWTSL